MKKAQAVDILSTQKSKLQVDGVLKNELWLSQTRSLLISIFGENSEELRRFSAFRSYPPSVYLLRPDMDSIVAGAIADITAFLNNCIETVQLRGVSVTLRPNFLARISDTWLTFILGLLLTTTFSAGFWFGSHDKSSSSGISAKPDSARAKPKSAPVRLPADTVSKK